jgi:hypothetical protein
MTNALTELLPLTQYESGIKCAHIIYIEDPNDTAIILPLKYTTQQLAEFLSKLNFDYNNDYGTQHLFGTVWFHDETWASREEYNGREWWQHNMCPNIPFECKPKGNSK